MALPLAFTAPPPKLYFARAYNAASYAGYFNHFLLVISNSYYILSPCFLHVALDLELNMKKIPLSATVMGPEGNYLVAQKRENTSVRTIELQVIYKFIKYRGNIT